jgi:two-component system OmpR family response regulator
MGAIMRILLIEDDTETAGYFLQGVREAGHAITVARDGQEGLFQARGQEWDLLVVDRMLPGLDGLGLVRTLRADGVETPVLFLTTLGGVDDRVSGLNVGADDYLVKPFAFSELLARVAALGRRPRRTACETLLRMADVEVNLLSRTVMRRGEEVDLQPREFRLLEFLLRHAGQVVTRTMLLEQVWELHFDPRTNVVDSHISRLRGKIDKGREVPLIQTVRGAGYMLREPA